MTQAAAQFSAVPPSSGRRWIVNFVIAALCLQLGLFLFGNTAFRLPMRFGVYGMSVVSLLLLRGQAHSHPARRWAELATVLLVVELLHPFGDRMLARVATVVLYASVLAPLLWVDKLRLQPRDLRTVLLMLWAWYAASAAVGVLQVNWPGQFDGALSANFDDASMQPHLFKLADGRTIVRPKGLTDLPGGAAVGGANCIIIGAGLLLTEPGLLIRGLIAVGMMAGLFCEFMCQGRTNLIVSILAIGVLVAVLLRRKLIKRASGLLSVLAVAAFIGVSAAFSIGGESVVNRYYTLIADDPATVFSQNRGGSLGLVIQKDAYEYPVGAGEGRWGMINNYFGTINNVLWAETMWEALMYDGGLPLLVIYLIVFASLILTAWKIGVRHPSDDLGCYAGVVLGYNIAALAACFVFPIMTMQAGLEVTLLNGCLYAVARHNASGLQSDEDEEEEDDDEPSPAYAGPGSYRPRGAAAPLLNDPV